MYSNSNSCTEHNKEFFSGTTRKILFHHSIEEESTLSVLQEVYRLRRALKVYMYVHCTAWYIRQVTRTKPKSGAAVGST